MARIAGIDVPRDKRIDVSLRYIYGIGPGLARRIAQQAQVDPATKTRDLTDEEVSRIREVIDRTCTVEGDLRRDVRQNIQRLIEINCYRGIRHRRGLPVRGQRTHTNARTRKGKSRGVMVKKKPAAATTTAAPVVAPAPKKAGA